MCLGCLHHEIVGQALLGKEVTACLFINVLLLITIGRDM